MLWAKAAAFVAKPAVKWIAGILGVAAVIVGVLWYLGSERSQARKDGANEVTVKAQERTIIIQRDIQRAEQAAPRTRRAVADSLRDNSF
jgi:hypothetical protein